MKAGQIVDAEAFARIQCNRCGECCERFSLGGDRGDAHSGPLRLLVAYGKMVAGNREDAYFRPQGCMEFSGQLVPTWDEEWKRWTYRCGYFSRDSSGQGVCGIRDQRPEMCRTFPEGRPNTDHDRCSWNVQIVNFGLVKSAVDNLC